MAAAAAELSVFKTGVAALFSTKLNTRRASAIFFPRIRSATSRTFRGAILKYLKWAFMGYFFFGPGADFAAAAAGAEVAAAAFSSCSF